ncbi:50S ribosomal protein L4 [Candidatus Roizmanbacteria bacterium]|nr:50S ribosomal protein L4 [Candidatus Roizmanbacteria bacterium]
MATARKQENIAKIKRSRPSVRAQSKEKTGLSAEVFTIAGKKKGLVTLPMSVFGVKHYPQLLAQVVRVFLANRRQMSARTKTRGDVTGSGRKIWRQKGTGRARHGDRYAPIFVGGGIAHGPQLRDFHLQINKSMLRRALFSALSVQLSQKHVVVVEGLGKIAPKSKELLTIMSRLQCKTSGQKLHESVLLATPGKVDAVYRAGKNIDHLTVRDAQLLHAYDVLSHQKIVLMEEVLPVFEQKGKQR